MKYKIDWKKILSIIEKDKVEDLVLGAYRKLKSDIYYDQIDLWLRKNIALFEIDKHQSKLDNLSSLLKGMCLEEIDINNLNAYGELKDWLSQISYHLIPKGLDINMGNTADDDITFFSNVQTSPTYPVKQVDYFFEGPIELYLISVLWVMYVGPILEASFDEGSFGSRLHPDLKSKNGRLFKLYSQQYERWRNETLKASENLLDNNKDVLLITLDFKECFYNIEINWDDIESKIIQNSPTSSLPINLTRILKLIHSSYFNVCSKSFDVTHKYLSAKGTVLPIGLPSSKVLSNSHLDIFDKSVRSKIEPHHYARYVDDIFIVLANPSVVGDSTQIVNKYFKENKVLFGDKELHAVDLPNMSIKPEKFIIQHFNHSHSRSALKVFTDEIKKQASEFRLLPTNDFKTELDHCAYDLIYKGSKNKWRSVIDVKENGTEVSKFLAKQIIAHRLSEGQIEEGKVTKQLFRFFQGRNLFNLIKTWEKVFTYFIIKEQFSDCIFEVKEVLKVIKGLHFKDDTLSNKLKVELREFLSIAITLPASLVGKKIIGRMRELENASLIKNELLTAFRQTNLLRHHYIAMPLLNYTHFDGDLTRFDEANALEQKISNTKLRLTPRFIHVDEFILFHCFQNLKTNGIGKPIFEIIEDIKSSYLNITIPITFKERNYHDTRVLGISIGKYEKISKLKVGIANIDIPEKDIKKSVEDKARANISFEKQGKLFNLINECEKNNCDMLILPEVSVPLRWLSVMVNHARKRQIALIFGVEHVTVNNTVLNFIATILPFSVENHYQSSFLTLRLKNHYAPTESEMIRQLGKNVPNLSTPEYHLYFWKGLQFTVYNCYELADLNHRSIFKSELDLLIASVWNKDTDYYANILESTTRDLYCYAAQVNTSKYGDSRIIQPTSKKCMNLVSISGGVNTTLQITELDIAKLRKFQSLHFQGSEIVSLDDWQKMKPCPPGFNHFSTQKRGLLEECNLFKSSEKITIDIPDSEFETV